MRTSKFSPRIRGELEGGKIKPVSFSTKASGIVKYLEKPYAWGRTGVLFFDDIDDARLHS